MLGKTNASSGGGSSGGTTVKALNATGKALTKGDKVWLNKDVRTGGTNYKIYSYSNTTSGAYTRQGFISPLGNNAIGNGNVYNLGEDSASILNTTSNQAYQYLVYKGDYIIGSWLYYAPTCIFKGAESITLPGQYRYIENSDNLFVKYKDTSNVYKIDIETGAIIKTYTTAEGGISAANEGFNYQYGNTLVLTGYAFDINEDGTLTNKRTVNKPSWTSTQNICLTKDKKHIIGFYGSQIRVGKIIDEVTIEDIPVTSFPEDLRDFKDYNRFIYNNNNNISTLFKHNTDEFAVVEFDNGTLKKLNVTIPFEEIGYNLLRDGITFSNDMSRAIVNLAIGTATTASITSYLLNFESRDGNIAIPYKHYLTTQETITGVAAEDAVSGQEFNVNVAG